MTPWWMDLITVPAVAIGAYLWLIFVLRLSGKRSLSKLNAFDWAITVAFGSTLATIILDNETGLVRGATALASLALVQFLLTKASLWSKFIRKTVRSRPTLLVSEEGIFEQALYEERVTLDELAEVIRNNGYGRMEEVGAVILETDGSFSVLSASETEFNLLYDVQRIGKPSPNTFRERRKQMIDAHDQQQHSERKGKTKYE